LANGARGSLLKVLPVCWTSRAQRRTAANF
jgi:hypothetical protein